MGKIRKPRGKASLPSLYNQGFQDVIADAIEFRKQNPTKSFKKIAAQFPPLNEETL